MIRPLALLLCVPLFANLLNPAPAQDDAEPQESQGWISSVAWSDMEHLVGTRSQGLLLRPAEVVKAAADKLTDTTTVGEAETSLWSILPLDGNQFLATDYKGGVRLFGEGDPASIECDTRWIRATTLAPSQGEILVGTEDGKLVVISLDSKKEVRRVDAHEATIFDIAVNPAGDMIASVGGDGQVKLFSWPELEPRGQMTRGDEAIWAVVFVADGKHLVTGGADRRIQLWDVEAGESVCTITRTSDWITDLIALPDSPVVVAGCMDGKLVVADLQSLQKVTEVDAAPSAIWSMALNSNGEQLALGTRKHGFAVVEVGDWVEQAQQLAEEASQRRPPAPPK